MQNLNINDQKTFTILEAILKTIDICFIHAGLNYLLAISSDDVTDEDEDNISLD